ncbi:hypothetical protein [Paraliobacillus ryukyuensis]|uniref:hypothetical protein n=1 Tax=Paraliobacillus ryukyuensis TaxID=200904 RepID=UPI00147467A0|nr:hypothetical protein [Paraliobacillus ryukyuensis]
MRQKEIREFALKLYAFKKQYGVEICSDNYYTKSTVIDKKTASSHHYEKGNIEID